MNQSFSLIPLRAMKFPRITMMIAQNMDPSIAIS